MRDGQLLEKQAIDKMFVWFMVYDSETTVF